MKFTFEGIIQKFCKHLHVITMPLPLGYSGLCFGSTILIDQSLTDTEKVCVLLEEIGHYKTTVGDIRDQSISENRKQELQARDWAAAQIISPDEILALKQDVSVQSDWEAAEKLCVTEGTLRHAYDLYKRKEAI